jgi:dTDP-4-dehydrorhamnose reductase
MVHISTDYVFDGTNPPYFSDSEPNPLNAYGVSKYESELAVREVGGDFCILRVPILYGRVETLDESPIGVIAEQVISGEKNAFDHWARRYPTNTSDVGFVLRRMIEHKISNPQFGGIVHFSGDKAFSKFEMAKVICDVLGKPDDKISPQSSPAGGAPRPRDAHLDCSVLEGLGIVRRTKFKDGVLEMIAGTD